MQKARSYQPLIFFAGLDLIYLKFMSVKKSSVLKTPVGKNKIGSDQYQANYPRVCHPELHFESRLLIQTGYNQK